jgi:hypothetical protein
MTMSKRTYPEARQKPKYHGPRMTPQRRAVIKALQDLGGSIEDRGGMAATMLVELVNSGGERLVSERSNLFHDMERDGIIHRELHGKRTIKVELTPLFREYDTTQPPPWATARKDDGTLTKTYRMIYQGNGTEAMSRAEINVRPPRRVEPPVVDLTETEPEPPVYDRFTSMARALLAEVLDLKVELTRKNLELERQLNEPKEEQSRYAHANHELRLACEDLQTQNREQQSQIQHLVEKLDQAEQNNAVLVSRVNELEFKLMKARERIRHRISPDNPMYPITELTEGGREAWNELDRLLREPPTNSGEGEEE